MLHPVPTLPPVKEVGWVSGPVWTGAENLVPTGIQSPDRPARRQSLYRLSYQAHILINILRINCAPIWFYIQDRKEWLKN